MAERRLENVAVAFAWLSALLVPALLTMVAGFLLLRGWPSVNVALWFGDTPPLAALLHGAPVFNGIWPACLGTLYLVALVAAFSLVPLIRGAFSGSGFCWLAALLTLAVLTLPTIVLLLDSQFQQVHSEVRLTAAALGFTRVQEMLQLTLPLSSRGLVVAATLGFGRALGDTLVPLMLAGNAPQLPGSLLDPLRTLTAHIALVVATDSQSAAYNSLFACGLILFLVTVLVNLGLRRIRTGATANG